MSGTHTLAAVVIHGMGTPDEDKAGNPTFHTKMMNEINRRVDRLGKDSTQIAWEPIHWHPVIGKRQQDLLEDFEQAGTEWNKGRAFVLSALGDASAYTYNAHQDGSIYSRVHDVIWDAIRRVKDRLDSPSRPLVVFANSLGGIMMSDYIWDRRREETKPGSEPDPRATDTFERLHTLSGLITFGCNMPLFIHGFSPLRAITFPHPDLPEPYRSRARWHNFYDNDDVLGYPLRPLGDDYATLGSQGRLIDHEIESGPIWSKWNPDSHRHYWTDNDFTKPVAEYLAEFLA